MPATAATAATKSSSAAKRITNPRRLLILTPTSHSNQTIPALLHSLTGVLPESTTNNDDTSPSFAGYTTHTPLQITNKYYSADVPIWVDEIPILIPSAASTSEKDGKEDKEEEATQWKSSFLSREAREVRDAIGAILICVQNPRRSLISRAVPREAYDDHHLQVSSSSASASPDTADLAKLINENNKDPATRGDVEVIKDLVRIVSELKTRIEEERNNEDGEDGEGEGIGQLHGTADVPGLLVLVDEHSSPSSRKEGNNNDDDDDGSAEPFTPPWWEDILYDMGIFGFEVISWTPPPTSTATGITADGLAGTETRRNIYGELEGLPRIKEVLSTHEWGHTSLTDYNNNNDDGDDSEDDDIMAFLANTDGRATAEESDGFRFEINQLEREMMGLRFAINEASRDADHDDSDDREDTKEEEEEIQVDNLEALMMRMRAIKDISSDLPETKRKAFAAKAVRDIMREL